MIRHVYLIQLLDRANMEECRERILSMQARIPEILHIEVGKDFVGAAASYDLIQICEFATQQDFETFTHHPYHDEIRRYLSGVKRNAVKVDYIVE